MKKQILSEEFQRMQKLAGLINESQLNEAPREGVYDDFNKWKASFPEGTEFKSENNYMVARDKENKELGKWNPIMGIGMHVDDFQYKSLEEKTSYTESLNIESAVNEAEEIKVGGTYIASMGTSNDGNERVDVKVKVIGPNKSLSADHFVIEPLETKKYTNPVSKQENQFSKGDHYNIEAKYLKPAGANESIDIESAVNEALAKFRKLAGIITESQLNEESLEQYAKKIADQHNLMLLPQPFNKSALYSMWKKEKGSFGNKEGVMTFEPNTKTVNVLSSDEKIPGAVFVQFKRDRGGNDQGFETKTFNDFAFEGGKKGYFKSFMITNV